MKFKAHRIIKPMQANSMAVKPDQLAKACNVPQVNDYTGFKIGIAELGGLLNTATFAAYCMANGYKVPTVNQYFVDEAFSPPDPSGADGEICLDACVIAGIAQGCELDLAYGPNTDQGFVDAVLKLIDLKVNVISISWGAPIDEWSDDAIKAMDAAFLKAKAAGIPVFCAAGDNGSSDGMSDGKAHTDYPACSPYAVACGGTRLTLNADGSRASEVVWKYDPSTSEGTGGGICAKYPTPDFQLNVLPGAPKGRRSPDIAFNSDPETGYPIEDDGVPATFGGTSAAAPAAAAMHVAILAKTGKIVDWHDLPYKQSVCYDVIQGTNGAYNASTGFDCCTGNGVPDGAKIVAALQGQPTPTPVPPPPVKKTWWQQILAIFGLA